MAEMYCFRCLVNDGERVEAVTAFVGTALCQDHAAGEEHLRKQMVQEVVSNARL